MATADLDSLNLTEEEKRFLGIDAVPATTSDKQFIDLTLDDDPSEAMLCEMCQDDLSSLDPSERQLHYETHFSDRPEASRASSSAPPAREPIHSRQNVFWSPLSSLSSVPKNFTPGVVPLLRRALMKTHHTGSTTRAVLCQEGVCHIHSEFTVDHTWGCGYRNFMMACTALIAQTKQPRYASLLQPNGEQPGVRTLQQWLEDAWRAGYDSSGARHFSHTLVGTRKWIGTGDLFVALSYLGIPAQLVDFRKSARAPLALTEWITNYFSPTERSPQSGSAFDALKSSPVTVTNKMPIVLQHSGHSRTVIGYECDKKGGINLLVLDPGKGMPALVRGQAISDLSGGSIPSPKKRGTRALVAKVLKRGAGDDEDERDPKRAKSNEGEAIKAEGSSWPENVNPLKVVDWFRVNLKNLSRKDEYQVLYFPLDDPLTESEKGQRRVVMSEVGC